MHDENAVLLAAKRQFLPLQSRVETPKNYLERFSKEIETKQQKRFEILQTWVEAYQELEAASSQQAQAKHEMAILVAENAKAVNEGIPVVQTQTTGSTSDQAAQQTILSVFKSVLSLQSMGCHWHLDELDRGHPSLANLIDPHCSFSNHSTAAGCVARRI